MRTNAGEQRASVLAAEQSPRRAALDEHPQPGAHRGQQVRWQRPLVAEEEPEYTVDVFGVRGPNSRRHDEPSSSSAHVRSSERYATAAARSGSGLA